MKDLETCRKEIDEIDQQMIQLFEKRMGIVKEVIDYKKANHLDIFQSNREHEVVEKNLSYLHNQQLLSYAKDFITHNMKISRDYQATFIPKNIVLVGIMGCGKTTIGQLLAKRLNRHFVDMDDYIVEKNHMSIQDMFNISEEYFRDKETECCYDMGYEYNTIISTGGGVVLRHENVQALKQHSIIVYLDRPIKNILSDIQVSDRPLLKDGADKLYDLQEKRRDYYIKACDYHVINDGSIEDILDKLELIINDIEKSYE